MHSYRPAAWLPSRHLMTVWGKFFRRRSLPELRLVRFPTPDGDGLTVAMAGAAQGAGPVLLILHGLEGGLQSHYLGGLLAEGLARGWRPRVLLFRTCDGRGNLARRTYHSGETTDLDLVVRRFVDEEPATPIGLVGVSLGGNVLLKWLGESGGAVPVEVRGAVAVSTPFDLARSSRAVGAGLSRIYQWNFLRSLKAKARIKVSQYPDVLSPKRLARIRSLWEFDDLFTAPLHGFESALDYYERSSAIGYLGGIRRPTLLLSAFDDPFYTADVLEDVAVAVRGNRWLTTEFHRRGGHVGFVGGTPWNPSYYLDSRVGSFLADRLGPGESDTGDAVD